MPLEYRGSKTGIFLNQKHTVCIPWILKFPVALLSVILVNTIIQKANHLFHDAYMLKHLIEYKFNILTMFTLQIGLLCISHFLKKILQKMLMIFDCFILENVSLQVSGHQVQKKPS